MTSLLRVYRGRIQSLQGFPPCYSKSSLLTDFHSPPLSLSKVVNVNIVYRNLKSENSQDYAQKPLRNCMFMNSASVRLSEVLYIARCTISQCMYGCCNAQAANTYKLSVLWTWYLFRWRVYYFWNISAENEKADTLAITGISFFSWSGGCLLRHPQFLQCTAHCHRCYQLKHFSEKRVKSKQIYFNNFEG